MKTVALILPVLVVLGAGGCTSPTAPPPEGIGTGEELHTDVPVILDKSLQKETLFGHRVRILVEDHGNKRTPTGTHEFWVRLRNVTDYDQQVQGRAHFLGNDGTEVEQPSPWQRIFLPAKSIETYYVMSTQGDEVKRFYVELREAR